MAVGDRRGPRLARPGDVSYPRSGVVGVMSEPNWAVAYRSESGAWVRCVALLRRPGDRGSVRARVCDRVARR